ncbi:MULTISPECIES: DUF2569 domain-containing protein [unclassified Mesorhizobium]|uniref:DUF2569 domain-containing protein n=1 Tax=unclassified Mesorhizobium TaxID=325217 RepID=UPI00086ED67A|nr:MULTISPECIES: DUF2569 domain-containing protein [unclassified Mesorhizobium]MBN9255864.1 DUF2569 domain-containing protein [Mesorhizobium sp.]MBN9271625.1 DUF2569 domain-containing protein [Mesorhizobium sp.]ODT13925.1 MAG: hypothetical protein ABS57_17150 [Mesorhizobium sp. SCN 65-12]OJX71480.1 MAG: hypothetical protein BGO93_08660 [Mesorhizobium sp. 65-26]
MAETQQSAALPAREEPEGIGGWLVLPMLGLVLTPIVGLIQLYDTDYVGIFQNWRALSVLQNVLIAAELLVSGILNLTAPALLLFFMFKRWQIFPGWYIIWAAVTPVYLLLDPWAAHVIFPDTFPTLADAYDKDTVRSISRTIWGAIIWIPYMMRSVRVANTFVN